MTPATQPNQFSQLELLAPGARTALTYEKVARQIHVVSTHIFQWLQAAQFAVPALLASLDICGTRIGPQTRAKQLQVVLTNLGTMSR